MKRERRGTHTAWGVAQVGRRQRELDEVGWGTIDHGTNTAIVHTNRIMRRDTGSIYLIPHDVDPPEVNKPQRPGESGNDAGGEEMEGA